MATTTPINAEDVTPVRTRISWGAVLAGAVIAFSLHFLLSILGAAVGLSMRDQVDPQNLKFSVAGYAIFVTALSLFAGGYVASLLTVGENTSESLLYGVLVWAVVFAGMVGVAAGGVRTGLGAMTNVASASRPVIDTTTSADWEAAARRAGVPQDRIEDWKQRAKDAPAAARQAVEDPQNQAAAADAAARVSWYAFFGTWISMLAAAFGGYVGAGPAIRILTVRASTVRQPVTV